MRKKIGIKEKCGKIIEKAQGSEMKKKKGVTLIVLIIIIVILLIILAVVLPPLITRAGIIDNTTSSKEAIESSQERDILEVIIFEVYQKYNPSNISSIKSHIISEVNKYNGTGNSNKDLRKEKINVVDVTKDGADGILVTYNTPRDASTKKHRSTIIKAE